MLSGRAGAVLGAVKLELGAELDRLAETRRIRCPAAQHRDDPGMQGRQREDAAEKLIQKADEAVCEWSAAELLRTDFAERRSKVVADPAVLSHAEEIDQLAADAGADMKAARDRVDLKAEQLAVVALVARLRKKAAGNADVAPVGAGKPGLRWKLLVPARAGLILCWVWLVRFWLLRIEPIFCR